MIFCLHFIDSFQSAHMVSVFQETPSGTPLGRVTLHRRCFSAFRVVSSYDMPLIDFRPLRGEHSLGLTGILFRVFPFTLPLYRGVTHRVSCRSRRDEHAYLNG